MYFSLYRPSTSFTTSHLLLSPQSRKIEKSFSLSFLSPCLTGHITLVIKRNGYLQETDGQAWLRIHLTKLADAYRIITSTVPINRSIYIYTHWRVLYTTTTNQERPLATKFGTRTHNQSILFIKGRYTESGTCACLY